jgi:hypothetical protein
MTRPRNKTQRVCAEAKTIHPMAVLRILIIKIGRLPTLSDRVPRNGELTKEKKEKTEKSIVSVRAEAPKLST